MSQGPIERRPLESILRSIQTESLKPIAARMAADRERNDAEKRAAPREPAAR